MLTKVDVSSSNLSLKSMHKLPTLKNKEHSRKIAFLPLSSISNGNRTEWSPIWSVIIRVITEAEDRVVQI